MIEYSTRPLEATERLALTNEIDFVSRQRRRYLGFTAALCVVGLIVGVPLSLGQYRADRGLGFLAFGTLGIYQLIFLWAYLSNVRDLPLRSALLRSALHADRARVATVRASALVELAEIEDEGAEYFFQVEEQKILYLGGQQYYGAERFPSGDFDLVEVLSSEGHPVLFEIRSRGERMEPLRTIGRKAKERLLESPRYPRDGDLLEGRLEEIESLLAREG